MNYYQNGKQFLDLGKYDEAKNSFSSGWQAGDLRCAYGLLAVTAVTGKNLTPSVSLIYSIMPSLKEKADLGDPEYCFIVARCLETGLGIEEDLLESIAYYQKAANLGNADAMYNLGCLCISHGICGRLMAKTYFQNAADAGCELAKQALMHMNEEDGISE